MERATTCPHCQGDLDQLGHVATAVQDRIWIPENLFRCRECGYGNNRFRVTDGVLVPEVGWIG